MVATVVRLTTPSSGCTTTRHLMRPALSTELEVTITELNAHNKLSARTVVMDQDAGIRITTRSIMPINMVRYLVSKL
jgi:hypothetical protein